MIEPVEFYHFAQRIYAEIPQQGGDSAAVRTCIGRAYYAAFLAARDKAKIKNESGSIHQEVIKHYKKRKATLGNRLEKLCTLRGDADYRLHQDMSSLEAGKALKYAEAILGEMGIKTVP